MAFLENFFSNSIFFLSRKLIHKNETQKKNYLRLLRGRDEGKKIFLKTFFSYFCFTLKGRSHFLSDLLNTISLNSHAEEDNLKQFLTKLDNNDDLMTGVKISK